MAKITGPLFSLRARGSLGDTLVYARWRGIPYIRTYVIPANPQSLAQIEVRNIFRSLNALWLRSPTDFRAPWVANATGQPFTDRNVLIRENVPVLQDEVDADNFVFSPGSGGAVPPLTVTPTDATGQVLRLTASQPSIPVGWTQTEFVGAAFEQGDLSTDITRTMFAQVEGTTPWLVADIDVVAAGTFVWGGWNVMTAPDGTTRYSVFVGGTPQAIA